MCGKLFSAIPLNNITSILLSDSVLSSWIESSFRASDVEVRRVAIIGLTWDLHPLDNAYAERTINRPLLTYVSNGQIFL